jgi:epoxyqueuosine reductase
MESIEDKIIQRAKELGFIDCGFSKAEKLESHENTYKDWISQNYHGEMSYLERNIDKRLDPTLLVENAKTVISLAYNYFPQNVQTINAPKIAKYAYGEDYHTVVKDQCFLLFQFIQENIPGTTGRIFVDSAPVMERQWAEKAGIGWIGKNSLLLRKGVGSFFFLAEIICSAELKPNVQIATNHCGECTRCIDECPTHAIVQDGVIDSTLCISYLTIEKRTELTVTEQNNLNSWIFGCDVCQDVCPWNRFAIPQNNPRFEPKGNWITWDKQRWNDLNEEQFNVFFAHTPLQRAGYNKLSAQIAK